jgi:glucan phosphoethanolaminetransferase (alkaline phosphatase superfamily)
LMSKKDHPAKLIKAHWFLLLFALLMLLPTTIVFFYYREGCLPHRGLLVWVCCMIAASLIIVLGIRIGQRDAYIDGFRAGVRKCEQKIKGQNKPS